MGSASLDLDLGRLDNRPPLLDLGRVERSQSLRRLLVARHHLVTQDYKPLARRQIGQSLNFAIAAEEYWR